jgi:hypothetical protein
VLHQELADVVGPPEVVLQVERMPRGVDQHQPPAQGVFVRVQEVPCGAVGSEPGAEGRLERRERTVRLRGQSVSRRTTRHVFRQRCASGDEEKKDRER